MDPSGATGDRTRESAADCRPSTDDRALGDRNTLSTSADTPLNGTPLDPVLDRARGNDVAHATARGAHGAKHRKYRRLDREAPSDAGLGPLASVSLPVGAAVDRRLRFAALRCRQARTC